MHSHIVEGVIHVYNSRQVIEHICNRISQIGLSISRDGDGWLFNFGEGSAILRPRNNELLFRISTRNMLALYGIQTIVELSLADLPALFAQDMEWRPGTKIPFAAIKNLTLGKGDH